MIYSIIPTRKVGNKIDPFNPTLVPGHMCKCKCAPKGLRYITGGVRNITLICQYHTLNQNCGSKSYALIQYSSETVGTIAPNAPTLIHP